MFDGASNYAENVDKIMLFIIGISALLLVGIIIAMIIFVIKYNRKRHPVAEQIEGNTLLEVIWIALPTVLVMFMFWYGFDSYKELRASADNAFTVKVTGKMWQWAFEYSNGKKTDTLYLPLGRTTKLELHSADVNHAFYLPAFRIKEDVIASRKTYVVITPKKPGAFDIPCAEYCGMSHSYMYTKLYVMGTDEFEKWYSDTTKKEIK